MASLVNYTRKEEFNTNSNTICSKTEEEQTLPHSFCEVSIITNIKTRQKQEGHLLNIALLNIDVKIFCKISVNIFQQYTKRIIYPNQVKFIKGMQECFNIEKSIGLSHQINRLKIQKNM